MVSVVALAISTVPIMTVLAEPVYCHIQLGQDLSTVPNTTVLAEPVYSGENKNRSATSGTNAVHTTVVQTDQLTLTQFQPGLIHVRPMRKKCELCAHNSIRAQILAHWLRRRLNTRDERQGLMEDWTIMRRC